MDTALPSPSKRNLRGKGERERGEVNPGDNYSELAMITNGIMRGSLY